MQRNNQQARHPKAIRQETEEQKVARLERELDSLYNQRDTLDAEILVIEEELAPYEVPFQPDDIAQTDRGVQVKILEVSPAFDSYVARVVYVDKTGKPKDGKVYTFATDDLSPVGK